MRGTGERFDQAREAWQAVGEPYERSLGPVYQRLEADVARLERAGKYGPSSWPRTPRLSSDWRSWAGPSKRRKIYERPAPLAGCSPARATTLLPSEPRSRDATAVWGWVSDLSTSLRHPLLSTGSRRPGRLARSVKTAVNQLPLSGSCPRVPFGAPPARQPRQLWPSAVHG